MPLVAAGYGVRLTLTPAPGRFTTVSTMGGDLHLDGFTLTVAAADHTAARSGQPAGTTQQGERRELVRA